MALKPVPVIDTSGNLGRATILVFGDVAPDVRAAHEARSLPNATGSPA